MPNLRPGRRSLTVLVVSLALIGAQRAPAQKADKGYAVHPRIDVPIGRPILVNVESRLNGKLNASTYTGAQRVSLDYKGEMSFIDEHLKLEKDSEKATRQFVKQSNTMNGEISDGIFNGLTADYTRKGDHIEVKLEGDRGAVHHDIQWLLRCFDSLSMRLKFPETVKVGQQITIDFAPLVPILADGDFDCRDAKAHVTLDSYDLLSSIAHFTGTVDIRQEGVFEGMLGESDIRASVTLDADLTDRLISEVGLDGTFRMHGSGKMDWTSTGRYHLDLTTAIGSEVRKARREHPKYRKVLHRVPQLGVQFRLPSYYTRVLRNDTQVAFQRTLNLDEGNVTITLELIDDDSSRPDFYFDKLEGALKRKHKDLVVRKVRSRIGNGKVYYIVSSDGDDTDLFQSEFYPWRGKFILYKMYGPPRAYRRAVKEFVKARNTIVPLRY